MPEKILEQKCPLPIIKKLGLACNCPKRDCNSVTEDACTRFITILEEKVNEHLGRSYSEEERAEALNYVLANLHTKLSPPFNTTPLGFGNIASEAGVTGLQNDIPSLRAKVNQEYGRAPTKTDGFNAMIVSLLAEWQEEQKTK